MRSEVTKSGRERNERWTLRRKVYKTHMCWAEIERITRSFFPKGHRNTDSTERGVRIESEKTCLGGKDSHTHNPDHVETTRKAYKRTRVLGVPPGAVQPVRKMTATDVTWQKILSGLHNVKKN